MAKQTKLPTWKEMRDTAKAANVNWRTVRRWYKGEMLRISTRTRIVEALKRMATTRGRLAP
jgi:hypothetical protein